MSYARCFSVTGFWFAIRVVVIFEVVFKKKGRATLKTLPEKGG
jgi:hypothetical protein